MKYNRFLAHFPFSTKYFFFLSFSNYIMLLFLQNSEWQICNYSDILSGCSGINNSFNSQNLIIKGKSSATIALKSGMGPC
jgi:hypothetical protein